MIFIFSQNVSRHRLSDILIFENPLLIQRIERYEQVFSARTRDAREQAYYLHMKRQFLVSSIIMMSLAYQKTRHR